MSASFAPPVAVDLLAQAIEFTRRALIRTKPIDERVRVFWAAVVAARYLGAADVVHDEFFLLAVDTGLLADLARRPPHAAEATVEHLIRWGMFARDPFGKATR